MLKVSSEKAKNSTKNPTERQRPSPPWHARLVTVFVFILLYVPLILMMIYSFYDPFGATSSNSPWTLRWYFEAFEDPALKAALERSLWVGLWCTLGATIIGTTAALAIERHDFPGKKLLDAINLLPLMLPEIVMGLSLLIWFVLLNMTLGTFSMIFAHITFSISYVVITVKTRLANFDHSLEGAARDLGASPWQTFWRITFPLIWPGILSGALMAFTLSFDDFPISFFTSGVGTDTLPVRLYSMIKFGMSPKINAISTMIIGVTFILVLLIMNPQRYRLKKTSP